MAHQTTVTMRIDFVNKIHMLSKRTLEELHNASCVDDLKFARAGKIHYKFVSDTTHGYKINIKCAKRYGNMCSPERFETQDLAAGALLDYVEEHYTRVTNTIAQFAVAPV